jgi:hypothetical protein
MITACPLSYVLIGVVVAAAWLIDLEARDKTGAGSSAAEPI